MADEVEMMAPLSDHTERKSLQEDAEKITILPIKTEDALPHRENKLPFKERVLLQFRLAKLVLIYLLRSSWLLSFSYFILTTIPLVMLYFVSISENELVAGCYAFSFVNISGISILFAVIFATNTKLSKHNIETSVIELQKVFIIWFLYCLCVCALWINSSHILYWISQNEIIARYVEEFTLLFMPGLFLLGMCFILQSYVLLVKEDTIYPVVISNIFVVVLNAILNSVLPKEGIRSGVISADLSLACLVVFLVLWVVWKDDYRCSWPGLSWDCLRDWCGILCPICSCVGMVIVEWWLFDIVTFILGCQNKDWLVLHALNIFILQAVFMFFHYFASFATIQAIDAIKQRYYRRGVFIIKASLFILWLFAIASGSILAASQESLMQLFANYRDISLFKTEDKLLRVAGILPFLKATQSLGIHIMRRSSPSVRVPYYVVVVSQLLIGFPIGLLLLFKTDHGIHGVWIGYVIGMCLQLFYFLAALYGYIQEFTISSNFPTWKDSLYSQKDIDDVDGIASGKESLLLRLPKLHMRFNSVEILCAHETTTTSHFGDGLREIPIQTILWRSFNLLVALCIFIAGFVIRYHF